MLRIAYVHFSVLLCFERYDPLISSLFLLKNQFTVLMSSMTSAALTLLSRLARSLLVHTLRILSLTTYIS
jgi:hypothetical protein